MQCRWIKAKLLSVKLNCCTVGFYTLIEKVDDNFVIRASDAETWENMEKSEKDVGASNKLSEKILKVQVVEQLEPQVRVPQSQPRRFLNQAQSSKH